MPSITNVNTEEIKSFGRDVLAEARRLSVPVPGLEANEKLFSNINRLNRPNGSHNACKALTSTPELKSRLIPI